MIKKQLILFCALLLSYHGNTCSSLISASNRPTDSKLIRNISGKNTTSKDNPYFYYLTNTDYCAYFFSGGSIAANTLGHTTPAGAFVYQSNGTTEPQTGREFRIEETNFTYLGNEEGFKPAGGNTSNEQMTILSQALMSYYGRDITFTSKKNGQEVLRQKLYIPQVIRLNNTYGPLSGPVRIGGSINLSWNADSKNENGVIIRATAEDSISEKSIENLAFAPDNGTYTVGSEILKDIPTGVPFTIDVIRGNLIIVNDKTGKSCKLFAYTSSSHLFTL